MTRVLRAVSTTSAVMVVSSLIVMMRRIWVKRRWRSRKFPEVMRAMADQSWEGLTNGCEGGLDLGDKFLGTARRC